MVERLTWIGPDGGEPLVMSSDDDEKYSLRAFDGSGSTVQSPIATKAPFQPGETLLTPQVGPKILTAMVAILGSSLSEHLELRQAMSRELVSQMGTNLELASPGILRYEREGLPTLEIPAMCHGDSPSFVRGSGPMTTVASIEFWCPFPYWQSITDSLALVKEVTGLEYPLEYPFEYQAIFSRAIIDNQGDLPVQPQFTVHGEVHNPTLINETTDRELRFNVSIFSGERLEIDTRFGRKSATHVGSTGIKTNVFSSLDLAASDFWPFVKGENIVTMTGDPDVDGTFRLVWRELVVGI